MNQNVYQKLIRFHFLHTHSWSLLSIGTIKIIFYFYLFFLFTLNNFYRKSFDTLLHEFALISIHVRLKCTISINFVECNWCDSAWLNISCWRFHYKFQHIKCDNYDDDLIISYQLYGKQMDYKKKKKHTTITTTTTKTIACIEIK